MKKQDMNILDSYYRVTKVKANQDATNRIYIMIVIGSILISLAVYAKLRFDQYILDTQISDIQQFLSNPQNLLRNQEALKLSQDVRDLDNIAIKLNNALEVINFMPAYDSAILNLIFAERPGTVRINSIDFLNGTVTLDVTGTRVYSISDYVLRLRRINYFETVNYSGYSSIEGKYNSTISILLKGGN